MNSTQTVDAQTRPPEPGPPPALEAGRPDAEARVDVLVARRPVHIAFTSILTVIGGLIGWLVAGWYVTLGILRDAGHPLDPGYEWFNRICITVLGLLVGFLVASALFRKVVDLVPRIEDMPLDEKVAGIFGVVLGLVVAVLLSPLAKQVPKPFDSFIVAIIYFFSLFFGILFAISMKKELMRMFATGAAAEEDGKLGAHPAAPKLVDTNVIIDGRILEVWKSRFVEGDLLVPQFVLDELQQIADSADDLKRARGRRGLELLNRMKEEVESFHVLRPKDYPVNVGDVDGVDSKLVRLASAMNAAMLTNDHNLSQVAELQGIPVLNVNRLALALKPVVLAGEEMRVNIIRSGRDPGQGVAYLDDGTMVVVEDGEAKVGRVVDVVVTSLLQTVAGKMIFAVLKDHGAGHGGHARGGNQR